ncbi:LysR family transcriptional regulator [Paragemmobacter ruber]|uniref:LysR family transcriptional regulator n=1 Tax=Paragemmobacter ruber TaxID=1985673 RepID=A0ABW9Y8Z4_9RHOB|nr:LysR family transcriptional regulator [Rhodobacter ruber]NBE09066.1 LysR family transcriptional regulator [Rhodobacter ruber]
MRLDHLRYFVEAARSGSISAAARNVRLAQPAFSAHIRALEQELGLTLLERSAKGVTLTEAGTRLYDGALSLFRHVDQVREETVNAQSSLTGEVRVVLAASAAPLLAGQLYWAVREAHPQIRLVILDLMRVESDTLVTSRQVDFGLLPNVSTLVGAASEPVLAQDLYLVGRTRPPEAGEEIAFSNLQHLPLVMGGRKNQLRIEMEHTAARIGHRLNVVVEQDSLSVFRSIALSGRAYTVVPYSAFAMEIEAGLMVASRIVDPGIERTLSFVWHEFSELSLSARAVKEVFRDLVKTMMQRNQIRGRLLLASEAD